MPKRRSNGEGTLRRRTDGRWELTVMLGFTEHGSRLRKTFYGKTQKDAKEKLRQYLQDRADGIEAEKRYLFPEWADLWFENHRNRITPTTQESYKYTLRILKDSFSRRKLTDIKPYDVENMLLRLRQEGRSDSCLTQCRGMMFQIMNKAEANDLIRKNPVRFAEKMRKSDRIKRKEAFTAEEVRLLMEKLPDDRIGWSIRLLLGTGMRTQELLALEPGHIAPDGSTIQICQAVNLVKGTVMVGAPKSRDSYRTVPVPETVRYCAINLRNTPNKYIWEVKKIDTPCNPSHFRDRFKAELEKIPEVRILTPHSCRHTFVSQMQALGVDLPTIQSIVGHADIDMTQHYLHVQDSIRQEAIDKFSQAFSVKKTE